MYKLLSEIGDSVRVNSINCAKERLLLLYYYWLSIAGVEYTPEMNTDNIRHGGGAFAQNAWSLTVQRQMYKKDGFDRLGAQGRSEQASKQQKPETVQVGRRVRD